MRESPENSNVTPRPMSAGTRAVGISKAQRIKTNSVAGFDLDSRADVPEHELLESNRHLKQAQELAGLATWEQDLQTNDITLSRQSYEMFGLDPALPNPDIETFLSRVHNDDRLRLRELVRHMLQARETRLSTNLRVALDDGSNRVVHMLSEVIWGDDGRPLKLIGITQDITERFAAAERLEHSTKLLQRAQEMAQIGSWELDILTGEVRWSRELFKLMGMDPEADRATDAEFISAVTPESWAEIQRERAIALATRPTARAYNIRMRRRDGAVRTLLNRVEYTWSEDGTLLRSEGTCQDITDQIEAAERLEQSERELRESDQHLRQAQQLARLGSWEHDVIADKVNWSRQLYEIFGLDPDAQEPSAELFFSRLHPEDRERLRQQFTGTLTSRGRSMATDIRITRTDGSERILHEMSEFVWSEDGRLLRQIGTMWDVTEQRAAAERLRRSEGLLNRSQELAQIGSWEMDGISGEIGWSRNLFAILGADPDADRPSIELYNSFVHPDDLIEVHQRFSDARARQPRTTTSVTRIVRRDGAVRTLNNILEYFWAQDGTLLRMHGTSQDITEQLDVAERLRHNQALMNRAQELAHIGSWEFDPHTGEQNWSPNLFRMLGRDPETDRASFELFMSAIHPDDRAGVSHRFGDMVAGKTRTLLDDTRIIRPDGTGRVLRNTIEYTTSANGTLTKLNGTSQDITEQLAAADHIRQSEKQLNHAQELAHMGSWDHNDVTGEINWSLHFFSILGLDPTLDRPSMDLFFSTVHPDDREMVRQRFAGAMANRVDSASYDARILHRDGSEHMLHFNVEYFWSDTGEMTRLNGTAQDITEQLAAEAAMKEALLAAQSADRAKSGFLANMSHELRTPLNAIIGFADILASEKMSPSMTGRDREYARDIRDSGMHLLEIINDVLDFSRFEAGTGEIRDERIDVAALFAWVVKLLGDKARGKDLGLTTKVSTDAGAFRGDLRLIRQALLNVVGNAIKFTLTGGIAIAAARTADGELVISVADTGIGMEPESIPAALTPFTQLENSLQRQYEGVGLGLPLAKRFVELHGGSFAIESVPDEGTVVSFVLPEWRGRDLDGTR
jgi:PAS domain S-box-containing protein